MRDYLYTLTDVKTFSTLVPVESISVRCHGCGQTYDARDVDESHRHTHHGGDSSYPRERLLELVNIVQGERDEALRRELVGLAEIAERLGRSRSVVDQWKWRHRLPEPACEVGGRPAWDWATIEAWARETDRLKT